ncbi:SIR2 family protein [Latilactobacillus sakei]
MTDVIKYPDNLVEALAYNNCVVFIGSGVSATAVDGHGHGLKTWTEFIEDAKEHLFKIGYEKERELIDQQLNIGDNMTALQLIKDFSDPGNYNYFIKKSFNGVGISASNVHRYLRNMNLKTVVSTNFDNIYENFCKSANSGDVGYTTANYNDEKAIIDHLKSSDNLIIKAHGSIESPENIIFTRDEYYAARREYPIFYKVLESLFLSKMVLFIGYSLNDPDMSLLLDSAANVCSSGTPHYVLVPEGEPDHKKEHWLKNYNIKAIEYSAESDNRYEKFEDAIECLYDEVVGVQGDLNISPGAIPRDI